MKTTIALCLLATGAESFTVPVGQRSSTALRMGLEDAQKEWKAEADRIHAMEHSVETDPDLDGLVEHKHAGNPKYIKKEEHRHDDLFSEIEHAVFNDPDLANVVSSKEKKAINQGFMEKEAHVHDSLLNEIEHALDNDSDLP